MTSMSISVANIGIVTEVGHGHDQTGTFSMVRFTCSHSCGHQLFFYQFGHCTPDGVEL